MTEVSSEVATAAASALAARVEKLMGLVFDKAPEAMKTAYKNGSLIVGNGLPSYLQAHYSKCETIRTLLRRDAPVVLEKVYVEPKFLFDEKEISSLELLKANNSELKPVIVSGAAGSGKSVFIKWSFRKVIELDYSFYPVFFELRSLQAGYTGTLLDAIYTSIAKFSEDFSRAQFDFGLKHGILYLMIDALDETPIDLRKKIEDELVFISRKYPSCPLIVTSRPNNGIATWEGFSEAKLLPFDMESCQQYISKIDFDPARKEEFLAAMNEDFFAQHKEFLSNALLAAMMLLTFDEFGEIPERRHIFYQKCFDVLLREHDHNKGKFRRRLKSSLDHSSIEHVFLNFCTVSYLDEKYSFTTETIKQYVNEALKVSGVDAEPDLVVEDFCESINVIEEDGSYYEFIHRSFQEFFYAKFCVKDRRHSLISKAAEAAKRPGTESLLDMIADMDRSYFQFDFVLPILKKIQKSTSRIDPAAKPDMILKHFCSEVGLRTMDRGDVGFAMAFHASISNGAIELNSFALFYANDNFSNSGHSILWPESISYETALEKLSALGRQATPQRREDILIDIGFSHHNRPALIAFGAVEFARSILDLVNSTILLLENTKRLNDQSLLARMRSQY